MLVGLCMVSAVELAAKTAAVETEDEEDDVQVQ